MERLLISEVSAVDDPAHELPNWLVQKNAAKRRTRDAELFAVIKRDYIEKQHDLRHPTTGQYAPRRKTLWSHRGATLPGVLIAFPPKDDS